MDVLSVLRRSSVVLVCLILVLSTNACGRPETPVLGTWVLDADDTSLYWQITLELYQDGSMNRATMRTRHRTMAGAETLLDTGTFHIAEGHLILTFTDVSGASAFLSTPSVLGSLRTAAALPTDTLQTIVSEHSPIELVFVRYDDRLNLTTPDSTTFHFTDPLQTEMAP